MNTCLYCGKELNLKRKKFCNTSCAAKYNNARRKLSKETKEKIAKTLSKTLNEKDGITVAEKHLRKCVVCGKEFIPYRLKNKRFSTIKVCSDECMRILKVNKSKEAQEKLLKEGKHKGWQSRNIISYAENFWIDVLRNNSISYQREYHFNNRYFLDFYIIKKEDKHIDLEIDGKQHLYPERQIHDQERDEYLANHNIIVYRIAWNDINTEKGRQMMHNKIDTFLNWYNNL